MNNKTVIHIMWIAAFLAVSVGVAYMFRYEPTIEAGVFLDRWKSEPCEIEVTSDSTECITESEQLAADEAREKERAAQKAEYNNSPIGKIDAEVKRLIAAGFESQEVVNYFMEKTKAIGLDCTEDMFAKCTDKNGVVTLHNLYVPVK